jgi:hypothetical protein
VSKGTEADAGAEAGLEVGEDGGVGFFTAGLLTPGRPEHDRFIPLHRSSQVEFFLRGPVSTFVAAFLYTVVILLDRIQRT